MSRKNPVENGCMEGAFARNFDEFVKSLFCSLILSFPQKRESSNFKRFMDYHPRLLEGRIRGVK